LAEDNHINQKVADKIFSFLGYQLTIVNDGQQAVEAALANPYDVILMDIEMPILDGLSATRTIRSQEQQGNRKNIIIAMTAHALENNQQYCLDAGMDDFICKPVNLEIIQNLIEKWGKQIRLNLESAQ